MPALDDPRIARGMAAQFAERARAIAAGAKPIGWKVGFGAPAGLQRLKLAAPLVGFLLDRSVAAPGSAVSLAGWAAPVAEPEICIEMGADLAAGADAARAAAAVRSLGPAIELADVVACDDAEQILAGNIFHRRVIFGPRAAARAEARLDGLAGRVIRNGAEIANVGELEANTGKLLDIVRTIADVAAACGERLRAGELIIAGSIIPPIFLQPGDENVEHRLEPIGSVSVRVTW